MLTARARTVWSGRFGVTGCDGAVAPAWLAGTAQAPIMGRAMPRHATSQDGADRPLFIPIAEAARLLGVSPTTVKRRIRAGTLEAEQLQRPQGFEYRVRVQVDGARDDAPPPTAPSLSEPATVHGTTHATTHDTTHARCFDELAASRQTIERQAEQLVSQAETIGYLRAEVAALSIPPQPQAAGGAPTLPDPAPEPPPPSEPFPWPIPPHPPLRGATILRLASSLRTYADIVRALAPWVLAVLAISGVVVLLGWPG